MERLPEDLAVRNVRVSSGVRPEGRLVDRLDTGRSRYGLLYLWAGEVTFDDEKDRRFVFGEKDLVFIPKGKRYRLRYSAPSTTFVLVDFDLAEGDGALFSDEIILLLKDDDHNRLAGLMADFELGGPGKTAGAVMRRKELFYRLMGWIISARDGSARKTDGRIAAGVRLLEATYLENLHVSAYAEASHCSESAFRRAFAAQFGLSPVRYRNRLRLERARELLQEGSFTVAEAAWASGFENVGYFCRSFRACTGTTPRSEKKRKGI